MGYCYNDQGYARATLGAGHRRALGALQGPLEENGFVLSLVGVEGVSYVTEFSTNLVDWRPVSTNLMGPFDAKIIDPAAGGSGHRFYRAQEGF